jgi:hypothetical protein
MSAGSGASSQILPYLHRIRRRTAGAGTGGGGRRSTLNNPIYLLVESKGKFLYVANQGNNIQGTNAQSGMAGYVIDPNTHVLSFIAGEPYGPAPDRSAWWRIRPTSSSTRPTSTIQALPAAWSIPTPASHQLARSQHLRGTGPGDLVPRQWTNQLMHFYPRRLSEPRPARVVFSMKPTPLHRGNGPGEIRSAFPGMPRSYSSHRNSVRWQNSGAEFDFFMESFRT